MIENMAFEKTVPQWLAPGVEPPSTLKQTGWQPGTKPPSDYFNWFWSSVSACLTELQSYSASDGDPLPVELGGTGGTTKAAAMQNLLVGDAIDADNPVDANTLTNIGVYKVYFTTDADTTANHLPAKYGILFVLSSMEWTGYDYVSQLFYDVVSNNIYQRTSSNKGASWQDWTRFYKVGDSLAPAAHTHSAADIDKGMLPVARGGTGAATVNEAAKSLLVRKAIDASNLVNANTLNSIGVYKVYFDSSVTPANYNFPGNYGVLFVLCPMEWTSYDYVAQLFYDVSGNKIYYRASSNAGTTWGAWTAQAAADHTHTAAQVGAMPISGGTFTGNAYAGSSYQTPGSYQLRNTKLSASEETPTANGAICWQYE